ncbi:MAG TPA: hypothetical protein VM658_00420 [bacterium]|nr:hypothetical protein [bacterium]
METSTKNRQFVGAVGDLVEALYGEFDMLPISDSAKTAIVMVMLGDLMKRDGSVFSFNAPANVGELGAEQSAPIPG